MKIITEKRSVIKYGSSLTVSLPAKWCKQSGVVKGSMVGIYLKKNMVVVFPLVNNQMHDEEEIRI